jgi:hypothetical protein
MPATTQPRARYADAAIVKYVRSLPQEFYLMREVSFQLGCAASMLGYLRRHYPELGPTHEASYGSTVLRLYTPQRIEEIRKHLEQTAARRRGQNRIFTPAEQIERRRDAQRIRNWTQQAEDLDAKGRNAQADEARAKATALRTEFNATRAARCEELGITDNYKQRTGPRDPKPSIDH